MLERGTETGWGIILGFNLKKTGSSISFFTGVKVPLFTPKFIYQNALLKGRKGVSMAVGDLSFEHYTAQNSLQST